MTVRPQLSSFAAETKIPEIVALHGAAPAEPPALAMPVPHPDERQIRAELERILGSEAFDASLRNRAFLRYVVDQTLAGHADYIKGYSVAQEVFQRDVNFDPQLDPVVRIEARRLRRSLELYYLTAGKRDFIRIELPKGGYVPTFAFNRCEPRPMPDRASAGLHAPAAGLTPGLALIIVRRFDTIDDGRQDCWARGLTDELVGCLMSCEGVAVMADGAGACFAPCGDGGQRAAFLLTGSLRSAADRLRAWAQLLDAANGRYLWVKAYDLPLDGRDIWSLQEEIAALITETIAGPAGIVANFLPRP